jgi:hypothetical protein
MLGATVLQQMHNLTDEETVSHYLISRRNYNYALPGSWISKALRISRCALVTSVRI